MNPGCNRKWDFVWQINEQAINEEFGQIPESWGRTILIINYVIPLLLEWALFIVYNYPIISYVAFMCLYSLSRRQLGSEGCV